MPTTKLPPQGETVVWLTPGELAAEIQIPEKTLAQWRSRGNGPRYYRLGRHARYRRTDVEAWLQTQAA